MEWILSIATVLGGIAAVWYFWDKIGPMFKKKPRLLINLLAELQYNFEHLQQVKYSTPPTLRTEVWDKVAQPEVADIPDPLGSQLNAIYRNIKSAKEIHQSIQSTAGETTPELIEIERHLEEAKQGISDVLPKLLERPPAMASGAESPRAESGGNNQNTLADRWITSLKNNRIIASLLVIGFLIGIWRAYSPVINYFLPKLPLIHLQQAYPPEHYEVPIDLRTKSARLQFSGEPQPFWLSIVSGSVKTSYWDIRLILVLRDRFDVEVRRKSLGWSVFEPNKQYNFSSVKILNPGLGLTLPPLFVKFPRKGIYKLTFQISLRYNPAIKGNFRIEVY